MDQSKKASSKLSRNAQTHAKFMAKLKQMTDEERIQTLVDAGILTEDLELAEPYTKEPVLSYRWPSGKSE